MPMTTTEPGMSPAPGRMREGEFVGRGGQRVHVGFYLLEREHPATEGERFVVHTYDANPYNLMRKGYKWPPLAMGQPGAEGDPRPLLEAAKGRHPDMAEALQAAIDLASENFRAMRESKGQRLPDQMAQKAAANAAIIAKAVQDAVGGGGGGLTQADVDAAVARALAERDKQAEEEPPKRGPGRPPGSKNKPKEPEA